MRSNPPRSVARRVAIVVAGAVLLLAAAAGPSAAHVGSEARGGAAVVGSDSREEMIAARRRVFGLGNVDARTGAVRPDRIVLSWFGVTNFAMAIRGRVVLLDAWVPRGASSGRVPTSPRELAQLAPEAIFIGHAHFDHAADATPIAEASGATLVGTAEQCDELRSRAMRAMPPRCVEVVPAGAAPGTAGTTDILPGVEITAVKHLHSAGVAPDAGDTGGLHVPVLPVPGTAIVDHPPTSEDLAHLVGRLPDAEGGSVLYRFRTAGTSLVWHDTSGPLDEQAPATYAALRDLRPVDVQLGAIQGFNQFTNGLRDPRRYIETLRPEVFVPTHHDDWAAGITTNGVNYKTPFFAELERVPAAERPREVRFLEDPTDYLRPDVLTFPLALDPVRLVRRCIGRGRLRVGLAGDLDLVTGVRVRLDRTYRSVGAPFTRTFSPATLRVTRSRRITATVRRSDGTTLTLRRTLPRCGVPRARGRG